MLLIWILAFSISASAATGGVPARLDAPAARARLAELRERIAGGKEPDPGCEFSMATYFVGLRIETNDDTKRELFREGFEVAERAVLRHPDSVPCRFWSAINAALYGQSVGPFRTFKMLPKVRERLFEVIRRDPGYAWAGAWRLLGLIEQRLPGILGGSNRRAREYFERAIEAAPDEPLNHLFLARLLRDELGLRQEARAAAARGASIDGLSGDRLESFEALEELRTFQIR
jgi:tetratricopeptide (TPR) repeat protein